MDFIDGAGVTQNYSMVDWMNETMYNDTEHDLTTLTALMDSTTPATPQSTTPKPCTPFSAELCIIWMIAAWNFGKYGIIVNYAVGIPGSLLTMILLARMKPFNSASVWLFIMSLLDFLNLTFRAVRTIFLDHYNVMGWTTKYCRAYYIFSISTENAGYIVLLALTVERFIAVWFPLKMNAWTSPKKALIGCVCIMLCCLGTDMHFIITMRMGLATGYCVIRRKWRWFWEYIYVDRIQGGLLKVTPMFLVLILNILIIVKLWRNKAIKNKMSDEQAKEKSRQQRAINRMLLAASAWFIFCVTPNMTYKYTRHLWGDSTDPHVFMVKWIAMNVTSSLVLYNHSGNFFLYVIAAKKFRYELIKLITCGKIVLDGKGNRKKTVQKVTQSTKASITTKE